MANFIGLVYATLKNEGIDTKGMDTDEAVAKYNELQKKSGGKVGEKEGTPAEQKKLAEQKVEEKVVLNDTQKEIIDDAIYWAKKNKANATTEDVINQLNEDMAGFLPDDESQMSKYKKYIAQELGVSESEESELVENKTQSGGFGVRRSQADYDKIDYPKGTSKEYTIKTDKEYYEALPLLKQMGIKEEDFGGKRAKEGGFEDNTEEILQKYVFKPFNEKYPRGNNAVWEKEYQAKFDAIMAAENKNYNDWYIKNRPNG